MHAAQLARHHRRQRGIGRVRRRGRRWDERGRRHTQRRHQRGRGDAQRRVECGRRGQWWVECGRRGERWVECGRRHGQWRDHRCGRHHRQQWQCLRRRGRNQSCGDKRCVGLRGIGHDRRNQRRSELGGRQQRSHERDGCRRAFGRRLLGRRGGPQGHPLGRFAGVRRRGGRKTSAPCQQRRLTLPLSGRHAREHQDCLAQP